MSRMKELRLEKQLTQRQLAEKIGVIPRYIGLLERDERKPSVTTAGKISKALGESIEEIFLNKQCTKSTIKTITNHNEPTKTFRR